MIASAANQEWSLRTIDISAAFLQGREIDRTIYVLPPPEIAKDGIVWMLKKGLYGLKEAARLWFDELSQELIRQGGKPMTGDPACFLFHKNDIFVGYAVIHVDDIIISGTQELVDRVVGAIKGRFKVSKDQIEAFTYTGMAIRTDKHKKLYLNQNQYLEEMENVPECAKDESEDSLRTMLRGAVGRLLYLNLTRPDLAFKTNHLSRVPPGTDLKQKIQEARAVTEEAKQNPLEIVYSKLGNLKDLTLELYADASFGGVDKGLKSTEGYILLLRGEGDRCAAISWKSKLISRVCKSAKSAETLALENAMDSAICIGRQLRQIQTGVVYEKPAAIHAFTDSASLVESIRSTKQVDEGAMRLHVERIKDHLQSKDIETVKWIPTDKMLADPRTKMKADSSNLTNLLRTGTWKRPA